MKLEIRHLRHFNDALKRDLLIDLLTRSNPVPDEETLNRVIVYGNDFLEREQVKPANASAVIWFDVHFGEPALIGLTWAYNPFAPLDAFYGEPMFWRLWSEVISEDTLSLAQCQADFAAYTMGHLLPAK